MRTRNLIDRNHPQSFLPVGGVNTVLSAAVASAWIVWESKHKVWFVNSPNAPLISFGAPERFYSSYTNLRKPSTIVHWRKTLHHHHPSFGTKSAIYLVLVTQTVVMVAKCNSVTSFLVKPAGGGVYSNTWLQRASAFNDHFFVHGEFHTKTTVLSVYRRANKSCTCTTLRLFSQGPARATSEAPCDTLQVKLPAGPRNELWDVMSNGSDILSTQSLIEDLG